MIYKGRHYCEEQSDIEESLNIEVAVYEREGKWVLSLYDGDGVDTFINYCPFCAFKLG